MKQLLLIFAVVALVGCGEKESSELQAKAPTAPTEAEEPPKKLLIDNPIIEKAIRKELNKPTGELIKADLEELVLLHLDNNQLTDVKGLEKLTQLMFLSLGTNILTEVEGLEKLTQLNELNLSSNQLTEFPKEVEKLTQLKSLSLSKNQLTNVKGLEKLMNLQLLYLSSNQLTDVKGLGMLRNLRLLFLQNNSALTKAQIDELKKALPKCKIFSNTKKYNSFLPVKILK